MKFTRQQKANAIRALSMDAVQRANSGHPGMPMGMADIAEILWSEFLKYNPSDPDWVDRDRFVLSNGHGSMLLYSLLHLSGYDLSIEDIKQFRQLNSRTPGHPEYGRTPGVETTTGPLGQGLANAVGMAMAERALAEEFNKTDCTIVDHYTYVFAGDGCLMEGISHEACSLAGTLGLGKLILIYDDNGISIDGEVENWFTDDTPSRFEAYGWHVIPDVDGLDGLAIRDAIAKARGQSDKPSLICCKTLIGFGSPNKEGRASSHGAPLGEAEVALARKRLDWNYEPFDMPPGIYDAWDAVERGRTIQDQWNKMFDVYTDKYPHQAAEFTRRMAGQLPADWEEYVERFVSKLDSEAPAEATRKASQMVLNGYAPQLSGLIGGSADLTGSNLTLWNDAKAVSKKDFTGRYIYYGVREFAMAAITNGIALHRGFIPFCATFLMFSEYARNALRMASLMNIRSIFVFTHDSIGLGEDGPTHQPVEQTATLRLMPDMSVWRPCDAVESAIAWKSAIERINGPTCLLFSRQRVPHTERTRDQINDIKRGGYILRDCEAVVPDAILIATGSEISLALEAANRLSQSRYQVRVVSMPSTDVFERQPAAYREVVLPGRVTARIAVEAGVTGGWKAYTGLDGAVVGLDSFGESAPATELYAHFGITVDKIVAAVEQVVADGGEGLSIAASN